MSIDLSSAQSIRPILSQKNETKDVQQETKMSKLTLNFEKADYNLEWYSSIIQKKKFYVVALHCINTFFWIPTHLNGILPYIVHPIQFCLNSFCIYYLYYRNMEDESEQDMGMVNKVKQSGNADLYSQGTVMKEETKIIIRRKKYVYYLVQIMDMFYAISLMLIADEETFAKIKEEDKLEMMLNISINMGGSMILQFCLSINFVYTQFVFLTHAIFTVVYSLYHPTLVIVFQEITFFLVVCSMIVFSMIYFNESKDKTSYLDQKKIERLLLEQKNIFEYLPDGLLINRHSDSSLQYINNSFRKLYNLDKSDQIKNLKIKYTSYHIDEKGLQNHQENIRDSGMTHMLSDNVMNLKNGQVIEVVNGKKSQLTHVVIQDVLLDDKMHTLTFFRDISFTILYEKLQVQQEIRKMMSKTFIEACIRPLNVVLKCSQNLEESEDLKMFEEFRLGKLKYKLREHLDIMVVSCEMILQKLRDMDYWQNYLDGKRISKYTKFDLENVIRESKRILDFKSRNRGINLTFHAPFFKDYSPSFADKVENDQVWIQIQQSVPSEKVTKASLISDFLKLDKNKGLPQEVYGDAEGLKQLVTNLVSNAVDHSPFNGNVQVRLYYDFKLKTLYCAVIDNGKGMKANVKQRISELFQKDLDEQMYKKEKMMDQFGQQQGLGLYISKRIVEQFDGQIDLITKEGEGTTLFFSMSLDQSKYTNSFRNTNTSKRTRDNSSSSPFESNTYRQSNQIRFSIRDDEEENVSNEEDDANEIKWKEIEINI